MFWGGVLYGCTCGCGIKKLLAKLAVDVAADAEKRRRLLILILAPVIGLLLLVAFIVYILTSPLSFLLGWLLPNEIQAVEDFQIEYGYNQSIGIYERDYLDGSGIDYGEIIFTDGVTDVVYFNQLDERYANEPYGTDKIGTTVAVRLLLPLMKIRYPAILTTYSL